MEWMPIESAPKDGSTIIGLSMSRDGSPAAAFLCDWITAEYLAELEGGEPSDYVAGWDCEGDAVQPHFWMPFTPPTKGTEHE